MDEIWININNCRTHGIEIIALSNTGLMKRRNGNIEVIPLRQTVFVNGRHKYCYTILAEHFIPKTEEDIKLNRNCIDHITHNPTDMNINDIHNLRWCTLAENHGFEEARKNMSIAHIGQPSSRKGKKHTAESIKKMSEAHKLLNARKKGLI